MPFTRGENANIPILLQACFDQGLTLPFYKEDIAYILATAKHETANVDTLTEYASGDAYEGRKDLSNNQPGDGRKFKGRGYVQITGRGNYTKFSDITGKDLVNNPDLVLEPKLAAFITVYGMKNGSFTGRKLNDFAYNYAPDEPEVIDGLAKAGDRAILFIPARAIVNGNDKTVLINNYARDYVMRINRGEFNKFLQPQNPTPPPTIINPTPIKNMPQIIFPSEQTWNDLRDLADTTHESYLKAAVDQLNLDSLIRDYGHRIKERKDDKVIFDEIIRLKDEKIKELTEGRSKTHDIQIKESKLIEDLQKELNKKSQVNPDQKTILLSVAKNLGTSLLALGAALNTSDPELLQKFLTDPKAYGSVFLLALAQYFLEQGKIKDQAKINSLITTT